MASTAFTSAGSTISVSADLPLTEDQTGYEAVTFTAVGEVTDIPEYGKQYNLVTHLPLNTRQTIKRKGSYNNGSITLNMAYDISDAGQAILQTALDSDADHSFKIVLQDLTVHYFLGQVLSYTTNIGGSDSITSSTVQVEITSDIVVVEV